MKTEIGIVEKLGSFKNVWPVVRDKMPYASEDSMRKWYVRGFVPYKAQILLRQIADERGIEYVDDDFQVRDTP